MTRIKATWNLLRYDCLAIFLTVLAALCSAALVQFFHYPIYAFFYVAVALSAWYGGIRPVIVATISAYILINYFFTTPLYSLHIRNIDEITRLGIFLVSSLIIGGLNAKLKASQQKLKNNLEALGESESRYRVLTENVPEIIWFAHADGGIEYFNQSWYEYTGLTPVESLECKWQQAIHPEDLSLVSEAWARALETGKILQLEFRIKKRDGEYRWHLTRAIPVFDSNLVIVRWFGSTTDIHQHKQIEQTLHQQELERSQLLLELERQKTQMEAVLQQMPAGLIIAEVPSGKLVLANPKVEEIWGRSFVAVDNIQQYQEYQSFHLDGRPYSPHERPLARSVTTGEIVVNEEIKFIRGDGTERVMLVNSAPIGNQQGEITAAVVTFHDITESKQAQEALRVSEARFRQMAEAIEDVFWISTNVEEEYKVLYVSTAYERIWGKSCESLYNNPCGWIESIHPQDQERIRQEFFERSPQGNLVMEYRLVHPDGSIRWIRDRSFPIYDETGKSYWTAGIAEDITDSKLLEDALKASEKKFRSLVDANIIGVIVANSECIIEANNTFLEIVGYTQADLAAGNLRWQDMTAPEYLYLDERGLVELQTTGKCTPFEKEYIRKDGSRVPILIGASLLEQSPLTWLCFVIDISERKQTETALRQSEERFRLAARAVAGIVYDWDVKTGAVLRSEGLYRLIGVMPENAAPTESWWFERIHPEDLAKILEGWNRSVSGISDRHDFEYRVRHEDGHWVHIWDRGYVIRDDNGEIVRIVGSSADISDRKRAEIERVSLLQREQTARAKAEEANRIKDEFLAVLSHELRSPLNPILGWTKLLRSRKLDPKTVNNALETIERNAKLQTKLIDDLLDVSRILRGKLRLSITPVNLVFTINEALETVRLAAEAKSLEIQTFFEDVGMVRGDGARLQQVVWNILSNAVKFTPSGGKVEIKLKKVDSQAQIEVSDTGIGIDSQFLPHIFEYFRQADSSTTRNFGGLGLGLAIVRYLVELHGGTIRAESLGQGQGATFTLKLPLFDSQVSTVQENRQGNLVDDCLKGVRVLTVDDEGDTRDYLTCALEQAGAEVIVATSAEEVLKIIVQSQADILLADIGMPKMDGYTLLRQIRQLSPEQGGNIPAIALTAYTRDSDQQQAMAAGFQQHISKPVDPFELVQAIVSLLGNGK